MFVIFLAQVVGEFFPISSSLFLKSLGASEESVVFDLSSALLFLLIYGKEILKLFNLKKNWYQVLFYLLTILPTIFFGYILHIKNISWAFKDSLFFSVISNIISGIFLIGIITFKLKKYKNKDLKFNKKEQNKLTLSDGFFLGVFSGLNGFFPGSSRLGMCLTYLIIKNKKLELAYDVSLISSIPVLLGRSLFLIQKTPSHLVYLKNSIISFGPFMLFTFLLLFFLHRHFKPNISLEKIRFLCYIRIIYFGVYLFLVYKNLSFF